MLKSVGGLCVAVMLATTSGGALAQSLTWRISEAAGAVSVRHGAEIRPAARNAVLSPGDAVVTGAGGRAVLVHDRDFVTVSANSRVTVPIAQEATGFTRIIQDVGNAIFRIEKLKVPHFAVKTPYLAAVVKGTTFSVTVDRTGTSLQVVEGAVEVATLDGGAKDLIRPGAVATIGASDLFRLQVQGDSARTIDSPARPADPPATTGSVPSTAPASVASTSTSAEAGAVQAEPTEPMGFDAGVQTIGETISSKPIDLASITGGMMTGTTAAAPAMLVAAVKLETLAPAPTVPQTLPSSPAAPVADMPSAASPAAGSPGKIEAAPASPASDIPKAEAPVTPPVAVGVTPGAEAGKAATDAAKPSDDTAKAEDKAAKDAAKDAEKATKDAEKAANDAAKAADDAKKGADDPAKAQDQAAKDADKAAKDAAKAADDAAKDAAKAQDQAAKDADKAAKDAAKAADDAAKDAAKATEDAKKAADDVSKEQDKAAKDAAKGADEAAKDAEKAADDAAKDAAKSAAQAVQDALDQAAALAKAALDKLHLVPGGG